LAVLYGETGPEQERLAPKRVSYAESMRVMRVSYAEMDLGVRLHARHDLHEVLVQRVERGRPREPGTWASHSVEQLLGRKHLPTSP
jgi:hypothetical protein